MKSTKKIVTSSKRRYLAVVITIVRPATNLITKKLGNRVYKRNRQTRFIINKCENTRIIFSIMFLNILNYATRTRTKNKSWLPNIIPQCFNQLDNVNWIYKTWIWWTARGKSLRHSWQSYLRYWTIKAQRDLIDGMEGLVPSILKRRRI